MSNLTVPSLYLCSQQRREPVDTHGATTDLVTLFPAFAWPSDMRCQIVRRGGERRLHINEHEQDIETSSTTMLTDDLWIDCVDVTTTPQIIELSTVRHDIRVSGSHGCDITLPIWSQTSQEAGFVITRTGEDNTGWQVILLADLYVDGRKQLAGERLVATRGMEIAYGTVLIKIWPQEIHVYGIAASTKLPLRGTSRYDFPVSYPQYRRSPRLILHAPDGEVTFVPPNNKPSAPTGGLLRMILPSLAGVAATIGMSMAMGRGWLTLLMAGATLVTTTFTTIQYFTAKRKYNTDVLQREQDYDAYLVDKVRTIWRYNKKQRDAADYHYPNITQITGMIERVDSRLYEKTPQHFDFLTYRLGLGSVDSSVHIKYEPRADQKRDALAQRAQQAYESVHTLHNMPIVADLMHGVVGYVGQRDLVIEQLQLMLLQVAAFHSYHDIEFALVFPEEEQEQWMWSRWLKHVQLHDVNLRGFVYNQRSRDHVLSSLNTMLKERRNMLMESGRQPPLFLPHLIIVVTDRQLIMDHAIMEFLQSDPSELGVSLVFVADVMSSLQENVQTVINIRDSQVGTLVMQEGKVKNLSFALDHFPRHYDKEIASRNLAGVQHQLNMRSSIPESLSFLEMYGVATVGELHIAQRWDTHQPRKTMAVPIGWRAYNDIVYLDLHEKADGPHGLLAGTTGSGKTEAVKDLVTSLAVNFKPEHVTFLPIDFKGGALANDLKPLPHTVGAITNLDASSANRALASIQAEMRRRQRLFTKAGVSNINDYHTEIDAGKPLEPIPHLIMISDEFAELKTQMPDFLDQLVSVARVGRSLGVHLILATQKPAGVVNDQIWANSKFKIALKVADVADSKEILKTPDAADITQTGRGYLQVGNNEKYELFQTAYSGAPYETHHDDDNDTLLIYAVNELGQQSLLNPDLSQGNEDSAGLVQTQMEAISKAIGIIFEQGHYLRPHAVWLPPLENHIILNDIARTDFTQHWQQKTTEHDALLCTLGIMDIPAEQQQRTYAVNLSHDGHLVFFGSAGYGKSTALQSVMLGLAQHHAPSTLEMYVFDFGTNGLAPMRGLPHIHGFFGIDSSEEIRDWLDDIQTIIATRKDKLAQALVPDMTMYYQKTGQKLPDILVVIDAYEAKRQEKWDSDFDQVLLTLLRSGSAVGIHVVMSASRSNDIRSNLLSGIKNRVMLFMNDMSDKAAIIGRTSMVVPDIIGRGLVRRNGRVEELQIALPAPGEDTLAMLDDIDHQITAMNIFLGRSNPSHAPEERKRPTKNLDDTTLLAMHDVQHSLATGNVVLGTDSQQKVVYLTPDEQHLMLVLADSLDEVIRMVASLTVTCTPDVVVNQENIAAFTKDILPRLLNGDMARQTILFMPAYQWLEAYDEDSIAISLGAQEVGRTNDGQLIPAALCATNNRIIFADVRSNFKVDPHLSAVLDDAPTRLYAGPWNKRLLIDTDSTEPTRALHRSEMYTQVNGELRIVSRIQTTHIATGRYYHGDK